MSKDICAESFQSAVSLCGSAEEPLLSGGRFDTMITGVPVHFIVSVLPTDRGFQAREIEKRDADAFVADTPNPINYITSTITWVEVAQTVTEDAFESDPATTYTLTGGTFTQTIYPATVSGDAAPATTG